MQKFPGVLSGIITSGKQLSGTPVLCWVEGDIKNVFVNVKDATNPFEF